MEIRKKQQVIKALKQGFDKFNTANIEAAKALDDLNPLTTPQEINQNNPTYAQN